MRLLRMGCSGEELPCVIDRHGVVRDVSAWVPDWTGAALDPDFLRDIRNRVAREATRLPVVEPRTTRIGPPVGPGGHLVSIGLNYRAPAADAGMAVPPEPIVSSK